MSEEELIEQAISDIDDWEDGMSPFFGLWNEWAGHYGMIVDSKENRPKGISRNITADTPRAVNALASSITKMQTGQDPYFELRSDSFDEDALYPIERKYIKKLTQLEFKRKLNKGNRGMCLFGTQVWEEPYVQYPSGTNQPQFEGTDFNPLSLLQVAFRPSVYDIRATDFLGVINRMTGKYLKDMAYQGNGFSRSGIWNLQAIEDGIKEKQSSGDSGFSNSSIESRRQKAGYQSQNSSQNELILWHGRPDDAEKNPVLMEMWKKFGRTDDIRFSDITVGILNRKHLVRLHPTPYGTWRHSHKIGSYIDFELEALGFGVGRFGSGLQKDMNRIMRYANDVAKFSLWNIFLAGRGSGLKSQNMNIFPFAVIQADDVQQIQQLRPQIEGILNGLKLNEITKEDFKAVTHASDTLQAIITGGTATETSLAQGEALRAVSIIAECNADSVIRPHFETFHKNEVDQNPYDGQMITDLEFVLKLTTDKDYRPEYMKKLYDFLNLTTSIRQQMPLDWNPMPILKYFARGVGINPREFKEPRPQIDRMLDVLQRTNANSDMKQAMLGEQAGLMNTSGVPTGGAEPAHAPGVFR